MRQPVITLDLEGVLIPEVWQLFSQKMEIPSLALTTRDIPDYDELMTMRLETLKTHALRIHDMQSVLETITPFEGALEFLTLLRSKAEVIILSDTFLEFFAVIREKMGFPTILCNALVVDDDGVICDYTLRMKDGKYHTVKALQSLKCKVLAAGDSYNDLSMIQQADYGALFRPPQSIKEKYPHIPAYHSYKDLTDAFLSEINIIKSE